MNCLPLLHLLLLHLLLLDSGLGSLLPAPTDLSVNSVNFHHVLRWNPGKGTPAGTEYIIYEVTSQKKEGKQDQLKWITNSTTTSVQLKFKDISHAYYLTVVASYNHSLSPKSSKLRFHPQTQTIIGPPKVSLAGCGNCIHVNVSLPEVDSSPGDHFIHTKYAPTYKVIFKERGGEEKTYESTKRSFTLPNLHKNTEYCMKVYASTRVTKDSEPSAWTCTFTSRSETVIGPVIAGTLAALLIFGLGALMASMLCLYYMGFLCNLKATLPRVTMEAPNRGYTLTPERTIPDLVSIISEMETQRKHNNPTVPRPATGGANSEEDDEEEEEEGVNIYLNKASDFFSGEISCKDSGNMSGGRTLTVEAEPTSQIVQVTCEDGANNGPNMNGSREAQTAVQGHVGEEEEEESSENVDLFSVTLAALAVCEEEEQHAEDCQTSSSGLSSQEPLLPTESESCDQTTGEDMAEAETQQEDEDDEEFSAYIRHMI